MHKIRTYCLFVIITLVVGVVFVTSKTYAQLLIATLLYLPLAYFGLKLFPRKPRKVYLQKPISAIQPVNKSKVDIVDIDKRAFLKLIGTAGLSFFLFSIFTKRSEALFFEKIAKLGLIPSQNNFDNRVTPVEQHPTDGYQISDIDEGETTYCGFIKEDGSWFILRQNEGTGSFRYIKGKDNFRNNWANRERFNYDYYHNIFQ